MKPTVSQSERGRSCGAADVEGSQARHGRCISGAGLKELLGEFAAPKEGGAFISQRLRRFNEVINALASANNGDNLRWRGEGKGGDRQGEEFREPLSVRWTNRPPLCKSSRMILEKERWLNPRASGVRDLCILQDSPQQVSAATVFRSTRRRVWDGE